MSVWDGLNDRPGSNDSLYVLYYLVRAAEEEDLLDEVRREQAGQEWEASDWCCEDQSTGDADDGSEHHDESPDLTFLQVLGMLEHLLGAEEINPEVEDD